MTVWDLGAILRRRWVIALPLLAGVALAAGLAALRVPVYYQATTTLVLLAPPRTDVTDPTRANPYVDFNPSLADASEFLAQRATLDPGARAEAARLGASAGYTVVSGNGRKPSPEITVTSLARNPAASLETVRAVATELQEDLDSHQRATSAAKSDWITIGTISVTSQADRLQGSRVRVGATLALLGSTLVLVGVVLLDRRLRPPTTGTVQTAPPSDPVSGLGGTTLLVALYLVCLFGVPSRYIFAPLGAVGTPANLVALLALGWWLACRLIRGPVPNSGLQPVRIAVFVFWAAVLCSYVVATSEPLDVTELRSADRGVIGLAAAGGIAILAADGIRSRLELQRLCSYLVGGAACLAVVGMLQFFTSLDIVPLYRSIPGLTENSDLNTILARSSFHRVSGTTLHPIEFGVVLAVAFPLAVHFALYARRRGWAVLLLAVIAAAIPMTISRSAVLGVVTGLLAIMLGWPIRRIGFALLATIGFLGLFSAAVPHLLGALQGSFLNSTTDPSILHRVQDYARVGTFIQQSPILGRGFNTFSPTVFFFLDNQYLGALIELGMAGLLALVSLFLVGVMCARGARRRCLPQDKVGRDLAQALAASVLVLMVTYFAFDALGFPTVTGLTFLTLGLAGAAWRLEFRAENLRRLTLAAPHEMFKEPYVDRLLVLPS